MKRDTSYRGLAMQEIDSLGRNNIAATFAGLVLSVVLSHAARGQSPETGAVRAVIMQGTDVLLQQHYEDAMNLFRRLADERPDHPAGFLYQAAVLQTASLDYDVIIPREEFDSLLTLAEARSERLIRDYPESGEGYFYRGSAYGFDAYASAESGDWWRALGKSSSSVSDFEEALERDSTLVDALAGIGTYYYWRSRQTQFLHWLPFISDDREEGIRMLRVVAAKGELNRYAAIASLISVYLDAEQFEEAANTASDALDQYPTNRIFLWGLATALERMERWDEAGVVFYRLLQVMNEDARANPYNELVCTLKLAEISHRLSRDEDALRYLDLLSGLTELDFPAHLRDRAQEKLAAAAQLVDEVRSIQ